MVYILPLFCIAFGLFAGLRLTRARKWRVLGLCFLAGVVTFGLSIYSGQQKQGWDGIGYVIVAALVVLPAMGGLVIGAGIGALRLKFGKG
jgi:apolipoprotein N-acyltransferase